MPSSASDARGRRGSGLRLTVLLVLLVLALVPTATDRTSALFTDSVTTSTVVSTLPEFAPPEP
ncbi:conserved hypothetical protein [Cellulomonas flavigena DSM 20109]|uniref:Uncharacterized protein n=1 Tax=Cellulomonas flavigena (strain ATCC 482 / DSM 20109 / BCRC 11376 / JCM 18109 / NBRC 3775 / NCIMB 8073 / NRS 134) TaxID=446466 RepID=D5UJS5_CELFN|nr:hypothetical protein [Cellulomonas flavigena]ADG75713.1 conserved hypothetical protein [Cellulomonas flavigena DSM 20109]